MDNNWRCECHSGYWGYRCVHPIPVVIDTLPSTLEWIGNYTVVLRGTGFVRQTTITLGGLSGLHPAALNMTLLNITSTTLTIFIEVNQTLGYVPIYINNCGLGNGGRGLINDRNDCNTSRSDLLYFANSCTLPGYFYDGSRCVGCPAGAYCPGGARAWPYRGYWSFDELSYPIRCQLRSSCPGAMGEVDGYPVVSAMDTTRSTDTCAVGYAGYICASCASDYYHQDRRCLQCDLSKSGGLEAPLIGGVVIMSVMVLLVTILRADRLVRIVGFVVSFQELLIAGQFAGNVLPGSLGTVVQYLSWANFDIQYAKPVIPWPIHT
jgi:hypothetical protein